MELELTHPYEAGLNDVLGTFFSRDRILEKNTREGSRNVKVRELILDEASARIVIEREVTSSTDVPSILASFHREWNEVSQDEHWFRKSEDEWHCEFRVRIDGVPAKIRGIMKLKGDGQSCTNQVNLKVRSDLPLIGKKLAKFLAEDSRIKIEDEYQATRRLLQQD
ncbi:DUF2505 domain-containing protein [Marinobacter sediminum]|uniref:DUF2505 domain-containing protein n=1 Tax=Marinobacter sediminum TaxID=256323 RepID=UPI0035643F2C